MKLLSAIVATAGIAAVANAQYLMVVDSGLDRVSLLDASNGAVVNANFIVGGQNGAPAFSTPKEAIQVGNEILLSDQVNDTIYRFSLSGSYLGVFTNLAASGVDNIRGIGFANNTVYVTNGSGALTGKVARFTTGGVFIDSFATDASPFDVAVWGNELLISDSGTDDVKRYDFAGNFLGTLVNSAGGLNDVDFPQQVEFRSNGNILVAGFSPETGIYEYTPAGVEVAVYMLGLTGFRGVYQLGNGELLATDGNRILAYDIAEGSSRTVLDVTGDSYQYISPVVPAPGAAGVLGLGLLAAARRRRA